MYLYLLFHFYVDKSNTDKNTQLLTIDVTANA